MQRKLLPWAIGPARAAIEKSKIMVSLGVNNYGSYGTYSKDPAVRAAKAREHGIIWSNLVAQLSQWLVEQGYTGQISFSGSVDAEMAWNFPQVTRSWVDGFIAAGNPQNLLYDFGSCDGCPQSDYNDWHVPNGWTQDDVWYIAWGAVSAVPIPLIYTTSGSNARQWQVMSTYAYDRHNKIRIDFTGSFTQKQSCLQDPSGCAGADNTPLQGHDQFLATLNSDPRTAQTLRWATDILWLNKPRIFPPFSAPTLKADLGESQVASIARLLQSAADQDARQSLEYKLRALQVLQTQSDQPVRTAKKPVDPCSLRPSASPASAGHYRSGILPEGVPPTGARDVQVENLWSGQVDGFWTQVYAGSLAEDPDQGVLIVTSEASQGSGRFLAPVTSGILQITAALGQRLEIRAEDGQVLFFDVPALQFVPAQSSSTAPILRTAPVISAGPYPCQP